MVCSKGGSQVPGGRSRSAGSFRSLLSVWSLLGPKPHSWPSSSFLTRVFPVSLCLRRPSSILFPWFQILNASQDLKDADLEYLEVRRHAIGGATTGQGTRPARVICLLVLA